MGPIHMNEVQCTGSEKSLWSCPHKNITAEGCKHSEDAGVRCNIPYMGYETTVSHATQDWAGALPPPGPSRQAGSCALSPPAMSEGAPERGWGAAPHCKEAPLPQEGCAWAGEKAQHTPPPAMC